MPEAVVDPLEVVDVHEAQRQREPPLARGLKLPLQALVEMSMVAEARKGVRQGQAHGPERADDRALVELDREQRADKRNREERRALPEDDEHQRCGSHQGEGHDRPADVRAGEGEERAARTDGDDRRDQDEVDRVLRRCGGANAGQHATRAARVAERCRKRPCRGCGER